MSPRFRQTYLTSYLLCLLIPSLQLACSNPPPPPEEEPASAVVKVAHAEPVKLAGWTEVFGTTQPVPNHLARISAAIEGRVSAVLPVEMGKSVVEGQFVKPGQVIVHLDDRIAQANLVRSTAAIQDLAAQIKQAELAVKLARVELQSRESLVSSNSTGRSEPLVSEVELKRTRLGVETADAQLEAVRAKQKTAEAELKAARVQLNLYQLRSPISGRLGTLQAVVGQTLAVGTVVAEVVDLDEIDAVCFSPPSQVARLALDRSAQLISAGGEAAAEPPQGKVVFIAVQAQPETGNYMVKVRFPNHKLEMRVNAVVQVKVETDAPVERLVISDQALLEDQDPPAVFVVEDMTTKTKEDGKQETVGKAQKLQAVLGVRNREQHVVEILSLKDPEKKERVISVKDAVFVVEGGHGLHDDDPLRIETEKEEPEKDKEKVKEKE